MILLLFTETTAHAPEHASWLLTQIEHLKEEFGPGLFGGFLGYFVHSVHHRIFHAAHRALPRLAVRLVGRR